jgi:hypothetical protein
MLKHDYIPKCQTNLIYIFSTPADPRCSTMLRTSTDIISVVVDPSLFSLILFLLTIAPIV